MQTIWYLPLTCGHKIRWTAEDSLKVEEKSILVMSGKIWKHARQRHGLPSPFKLSDPRIPAVILNEMSDKDYAVWRKKYIKSKYGVRGREARR